MCEYMDVIFRRLWCNSKKEPSKHLIPLAWHPYVGLWLKEVGLQVFFTINMAMLVFSSQVLSGKENSYVKILLAKYRLGSNQLRSSSTKKASWIWRSLQRVKSLLSKGTYRLVRNGDSILGQEDTWILDNLNFIHNLYSFAQRNRCLVVSQLIYNKKSG